MKKGNGKLRATGLRMWRVKNYPDQLNLIIPQRDCQFDRFGQEQGWKKNQSPGWFDKGRFYNAPKETMGEEQSGSAGCRPGKGGIRGFIGVLLFFLMWQPIQGQTVRQLFQQTLKQFQGKMKESVEVSKSTNGFWEKSEPTQLFLGVISLYQTFISSQDAPACNFTPSCSRFGQAALSRAGVWKGLLLTSDRLQRCNGLPGREGVYPIDHETHRFYDPIAVYLTLTPARDKGHHEHR